MKQYIEINNEGLEGLMGEYVALWCSNYIYAGKLIGVNKDYVKLTEAGIVYETGELNTKGFSDFQKLPNDWYVQLCAVESYGKMK